MTERRSWTRAELYLVAWTLARHGWQCLPIGELAYLAAQLGRSIDSVGRKSEAMRTVHPSYTRPGPRVAERTPLEASAADREVVAEVMAAEARPFRDIGGMVETLAGNRWPELVTD